MRVEEAKLKMHCMGPKVGVQMYQLAHTTYSSLHGNAKQRKKKSKGFWTSSIIFIIIHHTESSVSDEPAFSFEFKAKTKEKTDNNALNWDAEPCRRFQKIPKNLLCFFHDFVKPHPSFLGFDTIFLISFFFIYSFVSQPFWGTTSSSLLTCHPPSYSHLDFQRFIPPCSLSPTWIYFLKKL